MPRGRAGLELIQPDAVSRGIQYRDHTFVALFFGVSARTVRRWMKTGLPLRYGRPNIQPRRWGYFTRLTVDEWRRFCQRARRQLSIHLVNGQVSAASTARTGIDRNLSRARAADKCRRRA